MDIIDFMLKTLFEFFGWVFKQIIKLLGWIITGLWRLLLHALSSKKKQDESNGAND
jgi:hypothetical protein